MVDINTQFICRKNPSGPALCSASESLMVSFQVQRVRAGTGPAGGDLGQQLGTLASQDGKCMEEETKEDSGRGSLWCGAESSPHRWPLGVPECPTGQLPFKMTLCPQEKISMCVCVGAVYQFRGKVSSETAF